MGMIDRHKKPGGFRKLVNSLETTPEDRRAKIIEAMKKEDEFFIMDVEKSLFTFDEFKTTDDMILAQILDAYKDTRALCMALFKLPDEELLKKFVKNMGNKQIGEFRNGTDALGNVLQREQKTAQFKLVEFARKMEHEGKFILKRMPAEYKDA